MDKLIISGGKKLKGTVQVSGSKNAALPCLFATLLTDEPCTLDNVPALMDIDTTCLLLEHLGKKVVRKKNQVQVLKGSGLRCDAPYDLVRRMRASALVLGPLLARLSQAQAALPGGCSIGVRPIDIHLKGFEDLGATVELSEGMIRVFAKELKGRKMRLKFASVGATENLLMASVLASGKTIIQNAAREPEIIDCAEFLNKMGARIDGAGSKTISIEGVKKLHGAQHSVCFDRIEAATYLIAALATRGSVRLEKVKSKDLDLLLDLLKEIGAKVKTGSNALGQEFIECSYISALKPRSVKTAVYPGFPTDIQAQWMALMALVSGKSVVQESIFENRFMHVAELCRMGAKIEIKADRAKIEGVEKFSGAHVMVSDLRAGAAMVIAGLAAQGKTEIHRIYHLDRGYENLAQKFKKIGANIRRVKDV